MTLTNDDLQAIGSLIDIKLQPIHGRLDKMESRLDKLESEVSAVKANQLEMKKEIQDLKRKVDDTYELALEAWGTSAENRKWLESDKLQA